ncbi:MAG: RDD family protein [bacterium]|nr:RDD family protein [bacterium]
MLKGKSRNREIGEPPLADLPLHSTDSLAIASEPIAEPEEEDEAEEPVSRPAKSLSDLTFFPTEDDAGTAAEAAVATTPTIPTGTPASLGDRLLGGLADLAVQLAILGLVIVTVHLMEVRITLSDGPPFGVLALVFSFLYWFIPLAFWGQTPGMAWVGHTAFSLRDEPLSFSQTALRWLGALITLSLAGLPMLLALGGRSLTDRLSESKTIQL